MPRGGYVINVARGAHIVEPDLIAAVRSGHLRGAALDVQRREPMPADDPLWSVPGITITPHIAAQPSTETIAASSSPALARLERGEPALNAVDRARGYWKRPRGAVPSLSEGGERSGEGADPAGRRPRARVSQAAGRLTRPVAGSASSSGRPSAPKAHRHAVAQDLEDDVAIGRGRRARASCGRSRPGRRRARRRRRR